MAVSVSASGRLNRLLALLAPGSQQYVLPTTTRSELNDYLKLDKFGPIFEWSRPNERADGHGTCAGNVLMVVRT
jgi:hypothetical protein